MKTFKNDPAYPRIAFNNIGNILEVAVGLSKREYLAALNMAAMLHYSIDHKLIGFDSCAQDSVDAADSLIKALNADQP